MKELAVFVYDEPHSLKKSCLLELLLLIVLVSIGFALRSSGLAFGLPNESRQDEVVIIQVVINPLLTPLMHGDFSLNPHFFIYPSLYLYFISLLYWLYFGIGHVMGAFPDWQAFLSLYQTDATPFHLILRWASVVSGTGAIVAMYFLGRAFCSQESEKSLGLLSAALMSVCYLCIRNSHFGTLDMSLTLGITLSLWAILKGRFRLACLLIGLSIGLKYRAATLLLPLGLALWQRYNAQGGHDLLAFGKILAQRFGVVLLVFILTSPWSVLDFQQFQQAVGIETTKHLSFTVPGVEAGWIFYPRFALGYGLGLLVCLLALVGIIRHSKSPSSQQHWVLLSYLLGSYLVIGASPLVMSRYALPLVPVVLLYAALGILEASRWLGELLGLRLAGQQRAVALAILLVAAFQPLTDALSFNQVLLQPDTRNDARTWLLSHVKPGDLVATGPWYGRIMLPLPYRQLLVDPAHIPPASSEPLRLMQVDLHTWLTNSYANPDFLKKQGVRYVVLYQGLGMFANPPWEGQVISQSGRLVAHWSPLALQQPAAMPVLFDPFDAFYAPYAQFQGFQRPGPEIFIFDLLQKPLVAPKSLPSLPELAPPVPMGSVAPNAVPPNLQQPKVLPLGDDGSVDHG